MTFPENINYGEFYRQATSKGIKVTSRYAGVYVAVGHQKDLLFCAQIREKGKTITLGHFPFDKYGEIMAHRRYMEKKKDLPNGRKPSKQIEERYAPTSTV